MIHQDWESRFSTWASSPSQTEQERCENAVRAIRQAVDASPKLKNRSTKVFVQGSYRNRVNVRKDSDVDVGVVCNDVFLVSYPEGTSQSDFGNTDAGYSYIEFKNDLGQALQAKFCSTAVKRGNKAFKIDENNYRVNADAVPLLEFRQYWGNGSYRAGVALVPDSGGRIENYPERLFEYWPSTPLHYENGVSKNNATSRAYKGVVRILKCALNQLASERILSAQHIPGYLCECLVYNVPIVHFFGGTWCQRVSGVIEHILASTSDPDVCAEWVEVDEIKFLFHSSQQWTSADAHAVISDMRNWFARG